MQKFIDRVEAGETFEPPAPPKVRNIPIENIKNKKVRPIYKIIFEIEEKYGSLTLADEGDPLLKELREISR